MCKAYIIKVSERKWKLLSCVPIFVIPWSVARSAIPFSRGSPQHRDQAQVSYIAGGLFTVWATREAQE